MSNNISETAAGNGVLVHVLQEYQKADLVVITDKLPSETYHGWRYMRLSSKGDIIIPIGIDCNVCEQRTTDGGFKFGTIYKINPKTGKQTLIADGKLAADCYKVFTPVQVAIAAYTVDV